MSAGVIRLEATRGTPDEALVQHVLGHTRPASSHVRRHLGVGVEVIAGDRAAFDAAAELAAAMAAAKRGGKPPALGVSWLFAGGPDTDDVHFDQSTIPADAPATLAEGRPWTLADCRDFATKCHDMLREAMPTAKLLGALHLDEKAVHVQFEQPAVLEVDGETRVGNRMIRESLARLAPDFSTENERIRAQFIAREAAAVERDARTVAAGEKPKKRRKFVDRGPDHVYLTAQAQMRLVHDLYAHRFGRFGLVRGRGGKLQHHERVDREKGMEAKHRALERDAEAAKAQADAARADAETALDQAAKVHDQADRVHELAVGERKALDRMRRERAEAERERDAARREHGKLRGEIATVEADRGLMHRLRRHRKLVERESKVVARESQADRRHEELDQRQAKVAVDEARAGQQLDAAASEAETVKRRETAVEAREKHVQNLEVRERELETGRAALEADRRALDEERAAAAADRAAAEEDRKQAEMQYLGSDGNRVLSAVEEWIGATFGSGVVERTIADLRDYVMGYFERLVGTNEVMPGPAAPGPSSRSRVSGRTPRPSPVRGGADRDLGR